MKLLYSISSVAFICCICASCIKDFLEQPPRAALTVGSFPVTSDDARLATNAAYSSLRTWQINTGGFPLLDMMADDVVKGSNPGDGTEIAIYDKFELSATEGSIERWYKTLYEAIRKCNLVINEVPNINMNAQLKTRYLAEARFLRAYYYSQLVMGFGAVPKVTVIDPPLTLSRTSVEEILKDIIYPDLENAFSILPEKTQYPTEDLGRATKGAALGLLARVKLFYRDFGAVETLTKTIIQSNQYNLVPDFNRIFPYDNEHNSESIFEVSATPEAFENGGNQYGNTQGVRGTPNKGWGFGRPAYSWIQEMRKNGDPRLEPSVLFLGEKIDGLVIDGDGSTPDSTVVNGQTIELECYNQKVWFPSSDSKTSFGHNRRIIRNADILLMHAEALNENGKTNEALIFLNRVRQRARGNAITVLPDITSLNQTIVREAIGNERKYELAFEGLRFWDLVRTNQAITVLGPLGFKKNKNELFPIPQSEIDISQGRISQNPGY